MSAVYTCAHYIRKCEARKMQQIERWRLSRRMKAKLRERSHGTSAGHELDAQRLRALFGWWGSAALAVAASAAAYSCCASPLEASPERPGVERLVAALKEPAAPESQRTAQDFLATITPDDLGANATEPQKRRLMLGVVVVGGSGGSSAEPFLRRMLSHPFSEVRAEAASWYKSANPSWESDPDLSRLVGEALAGDPAGGGG